MIRATLVYVFIALYVLLLAPAGMLWTLVTRDSRLLYALARLCIRVSGFICGIRVSSEGREKIIPGKTYLFLSNHQGNVDGPVLCHAIPRNWKALIKSEMMRLPLLSLVMKQAKFVPIERLNPKQARIGIEQGVERLKAGYSFITFPEGTRSRDGRLGEFKKGAFIMAIKAQVPVLPVTIVGSSAIQSPGSFAVHKGHIRVVFHNPIPTEGMTLEDRDWLIERTRNSIASALS